MTIVVSTAADFIANGVSLTAYCYNPECKRVAAVNLSKLKPGTILAGPNRARLRCSACGGDNIKGSVSGVEPGYGVERQPL